MKILLTPLPFLLLSFILLSQDHVRLIETKENGSVVISARNISKYDFQIILDIDHTGVDLSKPVPLTRVLKAGETEKLLTITPKPETAWNYSCSLSYGPTEEQKKMQQQQEQRQQQHQQQQQQTDERSSPAPAGSHTEPTADKPETIPDYITEIVERKGITLMVQPGCGRTMKVTEAFDLYHIPYVEVPLRTVDEFSEKVKLIGKATGVAPREVISPIVIEDGVPTYTVEDLDAFIAAMRKKYGSTDHINTNPGITLYTKPGCGRCTQAKDYLRSLNITYKEVNLTKQSAEVDAMWAGLRAQGYTGGMVQTPIIAKDGKYYHQIPDVKKFLGEMVASGR